MSATVHKNINVDSHLAAPLSSAFDWHGNCTWTGIDV
jgi:hypothetical protein